MKKRHILSTTLLTATALALAALTACTDTLLDDLYNNATDDQPAGIGFRPRVVEQGTLAYATTRGSAGAPQPADTRRALGPRDLSGADARGLRLFTLTLPGMGMQPRTVTTAGSPDDGATATTDATPTDAATRAAVADIVAAGDDPLNFHDSLTIWGYSDTGQALFRQILLKKVRGWRSSVDWPYGQGNYMRFYAVAPALEDQEVQIVNPGTIGYGESPQFTYKVPDDPAAQRDLLYGTSADVNIPNGPAGTAQYPDASTPKEQHLGQDDKVVDMTFRHVLTAVRFAQGRVPEGFKIKSVRLSGIVSEGTYRPDEADRVVMPGQVVSSADKGWWQLPDASGGTNIYTGQYELKTRDAATGQDWTSEEYKPASENVYIDCGQVLFLMPHNLTGHATLEVTLDVPAGTNRSTARQNVKLRTSLEGGIWKKGYTVTYYLSIGEVAEGYYLLVDPASSPSAGTGYDDKKNQEHSKSATTGAFTIHSYRNYLDYTTKKDGQSAWRFVPWQVTGFSADGLTYTTTKPGWLDSMDGYPSPVETGNAEGRSLPVGYKLTAQSPAYTSNHAEILRANLSVSNFKLEEREPHGNHQDGIKKSTAESANCYIINAGGSYQFPAVYGNALGKTKAEFNPGGIFKDHAGRPIAYANVEDQVNYGTLVKTYTTSEVSDYNAKHEGSSYERILEVDSVFYNSVHATGEGSSFTPGTMFAEVNWQDGSTDGPLFTTVQYSEGGTQPYITFRVEQSKMTPCNAVIVLKGRKSTGRFTKYYSTLDDTTPAVTTHGDITTADEAEVLWSWHIWLTDEVYPNIASSNTYVKPAEGYEAVNYDEVFTSYNSDTGSKIPVIENFAGNQFTILPVNLGWVPDKLYFYLYKPRKVWVEIKQTKGDASAVHLLITQDCYQELITGTSTVYQWGRPNALPMVLTTKTQDVHRVNNASGTDITALFTLDDGLTTFQDALLHPRNLIAKNQFKDAWQPSEPVTSYWGSTAKTIYDPCPPGFRVPDNSVFTGISRTGESIKNQSEGPVSGHYLNMYPNTDDQGKADANKSGDKNWGGYIYVNKFIDEATMEANRYAPTYYLPATGEWQADWEHTNAGEEQMVYKEDGDNQQSFINRSQGMYWLNHAPQSQEDGTALVYRPDWNYNTNKTLELDHKENLSTALPIRPVATTTP